MNAPSTPPIIAITGPAGAGKSTVAALLAKKFSRSVNIDADHVKHFVVSGFDYTESPKGVAQWVLLGDNIGTMARNYQSRGYTVIINGYLNEPAWGKIQEHISLAHTILLLPELATVIKRDALRQPEHQMGEVTIKKHYAYFSNSPFFTHFTRIDSTKDTAEITADHLLPTLTKNG